VPLIFLVDDLLSEIFVYLINDMPTRPLSRIAPDPSSETDADVPAVCAIGRAS
jgi:hypothetical protein